MSTLTKPRPSKRQREDEAIPDHTAPQKVSQARKRRASPDSAISSSSETTKPTIPTPTKAKKAKRPKKAKLHAQDDDHDTARSLNLAIGRMDSQMLVDYV